MSDEKESSYYNLPVFRLNTQQSMAWRYNPDIRKRMCVWLGSKYRQGVVVCKDTMLVIAFVSPTGLDSPAKPPYRRLPIDLAINGPDPQQCPCWHYVHPDSEVWHRHRDSKEQHHPYCQYNREAIPNWVRDFGIEEMPGAGYLLQLDGRKLPVELAGKV